MKIKETKGKIYEFKPVTIQITFESENEFLFLLKHTSLAIAYYEKTVVSGMRHPAEFETNKYKFNLQLMDVLEGIQKRLEEER